MDEKPYGGRSAALATRHAKDTAIAPILRDVIGLEIVVIDIDTDAFGTFTGDIPRTDTPLNTAIAKARAGMVASGYPIGIASEGTIGPDPFMPFVTSDIETIAFVDDERGIVVSETTRTTDTVAVRETVTLDTDMRPVLARADFPHHGLIVRPTNPQARPIITGITDYTVLETAIRECAADHGSAVVESDLRACFSPSRMRAIGECATRLAHRLATPCPECASPGWGRIEPTRGLPCSACGTFVDTAIRADVFGCPACPALVEVPRSDQAVEPRWCPSCNP